MNKYFISRQNTVGRTTITDQKKGEKVMANVTTENRPPNDHDWEEHFSGKIGLGLSPLLESGSCRWAALDIDVYPFDIVEFSKKFSHLPVHFCRTKSGGLHIYFFFKKNVKAKDVQNLLQEVAWLLGFMDIEIFPKQTKAGKEKQANWLNLPYFGKNDSLRYAVHNGERLSVEGFTERVSKNLISDSSQILKHFDLSGAPPCIQKLWALGIGKGRRDSTLLNIAVFLKQKFPDDWIKRLYRLNYSLDKPLPDKEIENNIIGQVKNKDVFYTCSDLKDVCQRDICFTRNFGIGSKFSVEKFVGELRKITTLPPVWTLIVHNCEIDLTTEQLFNFNTVRQKTFETTNIMLPRIKAQDWDDLLRDKSSPEHLVIIEAPEDAGEHSEFYTMLKTFCITRSNASIIDDVTRESVFIEEGRNYFLSASLMRFIKNKVSNKYNNKQAFLLLKKIGGQAVYKRIGGPTTRLWFVPLYAEQENEQETRSTPEWKKDFDEGEF